MIHAPIVTLVADKAAPLNPKSSGLVVAPVNNTFVDTVTFRPVTAGNGQYGRLVDRINPVHLPDCGLAAATGDSQQDETTVIANLLQLYLALTTVISGVVGTS